MQNISRRNVLKIGGVSAASLALRGLPFAGVGALALGSTGCDIKQADIVVDSLEEALPIFKDLLPGSVEVLTKAIAVAKQLRDAIKDKAPTALGFLKQLIAPNGLINQLADTLSLIKNDTQRRVLAGILLLANIALRAISAKLEQAVPAGVVGGADAEAVGAVTKAAASLEPALKSLRF